MKLYLKIMEQKRGMRMFKIRGHHLICRLGFRGLGYDEAFVDRMTEVVNKLDEEPDGKIQVLDSPDVLCEKCPNLKEDICFSTGSAQSENNIREMDRLVMETLKLKSGEIYSVKMINERIKLYFDQKAFHKVCGQCHWVSLSYCEEGLNKIANLT
jgi:uncharacterized protein